jgi:hypothetical protein
MPGFQPSVSELDKGQSMDQSLVIDREGEGTMPTIRTRRGVVAEHWNPDFHINQHNQVKGGRVTVIGQLSQGAARQHRPFRGYCGMVMRSAQGTERDRHQEPSGLARRSAADRRIRLSHRKKER